MNYFEMRVFPNIAKNASKTYVPIRKLWNGISYA